MRLRSGLVPSLALVGALSAASWAHAVEVPGIPNFRQVNDRIYRGAQPTDEAWAGLAKLGIKTVIDLRRPIEHSLEDEARLVEANGMRYVSFPMNGFETPQAEQIAKVLAVLDAGEPVFVHCKHGKDRTGTVIAAYRIAHDRWENDRALSEAKACGMRWFEAGMKRFILGFRPGALAVADSAVSLPALARGAALSPSAAPMDTALSQR